MKLPIRARLTLWYVAVLAAIVAALGAFVVSRLRADLVGGVDRTLRNGTRQMARGYVAEGPSELRDVTATVLPAGASGMQLLGPGGRVLLALGAAPRRSLLAAGAPPDRPLSASVRIGDADYRVRALPVARHGRRRVVVAAQSLEGVEDATDRVVTLLLIAGPAALLATAVGGWWLARKALRPLDATLARLEREVEQRQRLVADASHELRTPLAAMRSEIDVTLDDGSLPPPARETLESAREEVDRLAAIVADLLLLARVDEGRLGVEAQPVDLRELAEDVARSRVALAGAKDVRLRVEGPAATATVDAPRLRRALANLLDNAIAATPEGTAVTLATWRRAGEVGVTVTDEGPGIALDARERIFERFARLDVARSREDGGSGLGLAICRELVEAHGGRVTLDGDGPGSAFSIVLPSGPAPRRAPPAAAETPPAARM